MVMSAIIYAAQGVMDQFVYVFEETLQTLHKDVEITLQ